MSLNENKFTGLICVKETSLRLPNKNFLNFGNDNLLNHKIKILLKLSFLNEIIINTESDKIISIIDKDLIKNEKIKVVKRNKIYAQNNTQSNNFCRNVAESCNFDNILYCPITCPLIEVSTYEDMYNNFIENKFDSVVIVSDGIKGDGHVNESHNFCFASCLIKKKDMIKNGDTIADNNYFQRCKRKERIDIDYYSDYQRALYYYHNIEQSYDENILNYLGNSLYNPENSFKNIIKKKVQILNCTIRDGGFINNWNFSVDFVKKMLSYDSQIGIDYFEIGYLTNKSFLKNHEGVWRNCDYKLIKSIKDNIKNNIKISVMIDEWRYDVDKLENSDVTGIDLIRVCCYFEKINDTIKKIKIIKNKGYLVSINFIASSYLTIENLHSIKNIMISEKYINYYYFADSFGNLNPQKIKNILLFFKNDINTKNINIGIHCHDNNGMAMANTIAALENNADIIDGSYNGFGRGGGNTNLEYLLLYLLINENYDLQIEPLLNFLDFFYNDYNLNKEYIKTSLTGLLNVHPYRLKKFTTNDSLVYIYNFLKNLSFNQKKNY